MENKKIIPWKYHGNSINPDANNCHRLRLYQKFICGNLGYCLDVGEAGYISRGLGIRENTYPCDFNHEISAPGTGYDTITCFEVINHVMNPLQFMEQINRLLRNGGTCYLSAPKLWLITWHHCKHNFVNYAPARLEVLFRYAGFEIVRSETHNPWPLWFMFCGVRPFLRVIFNRFQLWELRKSV